MSYVCFCVCFVWAQQLFTCVFSVNMPVDLCPFSLSILLHVFHIHQYFYLRSVFSTFSIYIENVENTEVNVNKNTSFYTDNITSTLTIVVFLINWLWMFALYVRQMCCKLELKTLNNRKTTASLRNQRKRRVCSDPCICSTQRYSFFFSEVLHEIWRIFPRSFDIVVISDVPTR